MKYEIKTTIDIDFKYLIEEFKEIVKDMVLDELNVAEYEDYLEDDINCILIATARKIIKNYEDEEEV